LSLLNELLPNGGCRLNWLITGREWIIRSAVNAVDLENKSYLLMKGSFQEKWRHRIPKSKTLAVPRINLTFRVLRAAHAG